MVLPILVPIIILIGVFFIWMNPVRLTLFGMAAATRSPLGTIPFLIKLPICIFIDLLGVIQWITFFTTIILPFSWLPNLVGAITYAAIQAIIGMLFWGFPMFVPIFFLEAVVTINAIPSMTMMCLWHGYKTGWRY